MNRLLWPASSGRDRCTKVKVRGDRCSSAVTSATSCVLLVLTLNRSILARPLLPADLVSSPVGVPGPGIEGELLLRREQGGGAAVVMDDVEHAGHVPARGPVHGRAGVGVERDPVATASVVDPAAGQHTRVVRQRPGLFLRRPRVERRRPCLISRWKFGVPEAPSFRMAFGFRPSTEIATTRFTAIVGRALHRCPDGTRDGRSVGCGNSGRTCGPGGGRSGNGARRDGRTREQTDEGESCRPASRVSRGEVIQAP